ncbi:MAG TPA: class E sortase [Solirubrobacteraceae bacterium]|nr:class E sortase [Solirubrobacteraceae bacterium]
MAEYPITQRAPAGALQQPRKKASRSSRAARWLAILLIFAGGLALVDGAITLLWQEPISALIGKLRQDHLKGELAQVEAVRPSVAEERALAGIAGERRRVAYLAGQLQHSAKNGSPIGRIVIPAIGASYVMVDGTDTSDLESGPGFYRATTFPGIAGTTLIAGHRTTYLAPFRHIDSLKPGDEIHLNMPYAHFTYTVVGHRIVQPENVAAATAEVGYSRVVLSACTPLFSAAKRWLVYARLTRATPVGAARLLTGGQLARPIQYPLRPAKSRSVPPVLESLGPYYVAPSS